MSGCNEAQDVPAELASVGLVRHCVDAAERQSGLDEATGGLFTVACVEAFTNIVRHARGRPAGAPIRMGVTCLDDRLEVEFVYRGEPYEAPEHVEPVRTDDYPEGGFGLEIMRMASDALAYLHADGVNTVRLTRLLSPARA